MLEWLVSGGVQEMVTLAPGSALEAGWADEGAEDIWEEELSCWRWNKVLVSTGHCSAARNSPLGPALLS